jgi:hypothetical protein
VWLEKAKRTVEIGDAALHRDIEFGTCLAPGRLENRVQARDKPRSEASIMDHGGERSKKLAKLGPMH